jgi:DNA polymerase-3 subunit gamma/tau
MTYLALARKWRPQTFTDVVGQSHIVRALSNALSSGRVHHAFLFAGTRGVGKTTVARILARCLNCEKGVTAEPCGQCRACVGIEEGRFVDLIEVDAASRTGVDDIRELLDNVQYTPAAGRFKVYLIDEVHMLSKAAFNALLKTLEEPPPHVKFLFATTDPDRLPVTVLSRCLQFNLKRLPNQVVVDRMATICAAEGISAESAALLQLARAGAGSMRDSLSLLDQALAFGDGQLRAADVAAMLGTIDRRRIMALMADLAGGDAVTVLARLRELDEFVPDYGVLLGDLATCFQQLAVLQLAGPDVLDDDADAPALERLAKAFDPETVQLCYEIAVRGRRDLDLAPEPRLGCEMLLLRMLSFRLVSPATAAAPAGAASPAGPAPPTPPPARTRAERADDWPAIAAELPLEGAARQLVEHCALTARSPGELRLAVPPADAHLLTVQLQARVTAAIHKRLGDDLRVVIEVGNGPAAEPAPAALDAQLQDEALRRARAAIDADPNVRDLAAMFGAQVMPESVKPVQRPADDTRRGRRTGH